MNKNKYLGALAIIVTLAAAGSAAHVHAQTMSASATAAPTAPWQNDGEGHRGMGMDHQGMRPTAFGTVSSINGSTITINSVNPTTSVATTYTVDATNAKIMKNRTAGTISSIATGDTIMVMGTLNGTNITATSINDGMMMRGAGMGMKGDRPMGTATGTMQMMPQGNGQPIVGGTVTSVSGSTITITNTSNATFTIDATNATINKRGVSTATVSNIAVGDSIMVQGAVNGQNVTAHSVMDNGVAQTTTAPGAPEAQPQAHTSFIGRVGGFFKHLFGF